MHTYPHIRLSKDLEKTMFRPQRQKYESCMLKGYDTGKGSSRTSLTPRMISRAASPTPSVTYPGTPDESDWTRRAFSPEPPPTPGGPNDLNAVSFEMPLARMFGGSASPNMKRKHKHISTLEIEKMREEVQAMQEELVESKNELLEAKNELFAAKQALEKSQKLRAVCKSDNNQLWKRVMRLEEGNADLKEANGILTEELENTIDGTSENTKEQNTEREKRQTEFYKRTSWTDEGDLELGDDKNPFVCDTTRVQQILRDTPVKESPKEWLVWVVELLTSGTVSSKEDHEKISGDLVETISGRNPTFWK